LPEESNSREVSLPTYPLESTVCISQEGSENKGEVKKRRKKENFRYLNITFLTLKVYLILKIFARVEGVFLEQEYRESFIVGG